LVAASLTAVDGFGAFFHDIFGGNVLLFNENVEPISKIVDHAQKKGTGRRKSAAYTI
jgi:uncharacterized Fe-S cluster-containing radical SAM superfamily enzyme